MKYISWLVFLFIGLVIGLLIKRVPFISLEQSTTIGELSNLILTIIIAILIPFSLDKWINEKRYLKEFLIDEIKGCITEIELISGFIHERYKEDKILDKKSKRELMKMFKKSDNKFNSLFIQLETAYKSKTKNIIEEIKKENIEYWKLVTGGALMTDSFKVDERFCNDHNRAFLKIESCLKKSIHRINEY